MESGIPPIGHDAFRAAGMQPDGGVSRAGRANAGKEDFSVLLDQGGPPPELKAEMATAAKVAADLHAQGRELRFERDDRTGKIRVELRDLEGNVLRVIPSSKALDIARGAPL